ncbi:MULTISPECIES: helix-turn-helix transcriptional regulator [unclassified Exiguobacterium]|uniref:helix-turn-helix transcriptional regulator n=1 Tax=unclassified Exiguobacterium TaxID=2644629 RepID=UPI000E84EFCC|nr:MULTISPECIES: helix-turn-helix transcriptional regulator [unclassified Exiguobacterium]HAK99605.1 transcriptional regulator [Exiguobacterium sp.]HBF59532.1 transcriptional regulator [Exiguobacterium sp.]HCV52711.1 transcriptional regulator [Exiguobacterium sp.]
MRNHIKERRLTAKLSQQELADRCQVSRQTINAIENNKYDPTLQLAFNIAKVLQTQVDHLFISEQEEWDV